MAYLLLLNTTKLNALVDIQFDQIYIAKYLSTVLCAKYRAGS